MTLTLNPHPDPNPYGPDLAGSEPPEAAVDRKLCILVRPQQHQHRHGAREGGCWSKRVGALLHTSARTPSGAQSMPHTRASHLSSSPHGLARQCLSLLLPLPLPLPLSSARINIAHHGSTSPAPLNQALHPCPPAPACMSLYLNPAPSSHPWLKFPCTHPPVPHSQALTCLAAGQGAGAGGRHVQPLPRVRPR